MTLRKIYATGILTTAVAAIMAIAVFCGMFLGANAFAFAAATNNPAAIPSAQDGPRAAVVADAAAPQGFQSPSLTIVERTHEGQQPIAKSARAMSIEEAAELGAQYIWDMYGESIDGKRVDLFYASFPSSTRAYWLGYVIDPFETEVENAQGHMVIGVERYNFSLDAITGERIGIGKAFPTSIDWDFTMEEILDLRLRFMNPTFTPEQMDKYAQLAKDYADVHFAFTNVVSVTFSHATPAIYARDLAGSLEATNYVLWFDVTDDTGREAKVSIISELGQLFILDTQHCDIVPGFGADVRGIG